MATTGAKPLDLDNNFGNLDRQWAGLFALCEDPALYSARCESVSGWGVDRHVNHTGIALGLIAGAIEGMLANPAQGVGLKPGHPFAQPLLDGGMIPRGAAQAPDFLIPPDSPTAGESLTLLSANRAKWDALSKRRAEIAACPATFPHFALGNFTGAEWVRFITVHTAHHYKIIRDILDSAGLKAPFEKSVEELA